MSTCTCTVRTCTGIAGLSGPTMTVFFNVHMQKSHYSPSQMHMYSVHVGAVAYQIDHHVLSQSANGHWPTM